MRVSETELRSLYLIKGLTSDQIGKIVGVSGRSVRYWLTKIGLGDEMKRRRQTVAKGIAPANKGKHKQHLALGRVYINHGGKTVPRYRVVMEQKLGRKLSSREVVHHKDGNPLNDSVENLEVLTQSEHVKLHNPVVSRWRKTKPR